MDIFYPIDNGFFVIALVPEYLAALQSYRQLRQHRIIGNKKSLRIEKYEMQRFSLYFYSQGRTELGCQTFPVSQIQIRQCEHHI